MAGKSVRKERANKRGLKLVILVTLIFIAVFSVLIIRLRKSNEVLYQNQAGLQASVDAEKEKQEELAAQQGGNLSLDEIIRIAKDRFGLVFKNEIIFVPENKE